MEDGAQRRDGLGHGRRRFLIRDQSNIPTFTDVYFYGVNAMILMMITIINACEIIATRARIHRTERRYILFIQRKTNLGSPRLGERLPLPPSLLRRRLVY